MLTLPVLHSVPVAGKDYELKLPKDHLSYSQINQYMNCPQQYYREQIEHKPNNYSSEAFEGVSMAYTLEAIGNAKKQDKKLPTIKALMKRWEVFTELNSAEVTQWNDYIPVLRDRAQQFLTMFIAQEATELRPTGVEQDFALNIAGVPVVGRADIVEQRYVWDYKVTGNPFYLKPDTSLQLDLYSLAFQKNHVGYIVLDRKKPDALKIMQIRSTRLDLEKTQRWVEIVVSGVAQAISKGVFPVCDPAKNALCSEKWCGQWHDCRGACT